MGQGAIKLSDMAEYIRVVMGLLRDETLETTLEGKRQKIRFLNADLGLINTRDPVALHVSAFGPKGMELTARLGAGWINFVGNDAVGIAWLRQMQQAWEQAGRDRADLSAVAFALGCVLEDGEPCDSPRAMAQAGPRAAVMLHRAADEALSGLPNSSPMPPAVADLVAGYVEASVSRISAPAAPASPSRASAGLVSPPFTVPQSEYPETPSPCPRAYQRAAPAPARR